jgi:hypothetical protein
MSPSSRRTALVRPCRIAALVLAAGALVPSLARSQEPEHMEGPEIVAEALFLYDALPPGGRDLNLTFAVQEGEPDPVTGETEFISLPRMQLAMALGERVGFTADVGIATDGSAILDTPGASLKYLLRAADADTTGLAASLDLFGSTHSLSDTEAGLGLGAIRALGPLALRAAASLSTGVSSWSPHLHGGLSAAVALGSRWRALAEVVTDVAGGEAAVAAGPTVKLALGEHTALMAGALFQVAPSVATPVFTIQLTQSM